jgi:hypothetical protein
MAARGDGGLGIGGCVPGKVGGTDEVGMADDGASRTVGEREVGSDANGGVEIARFVKAASPELSRPFKNGTVAANDKGCARGGEQHLRCEKPRNAGSSIFVEQPGQARLRIGERPDGYDQGDVGVIS